MPRGRSLKSCKALGMFSETKQKNYRGCFKAERFNFDAFLYKASIFQYFLLDSN